MSPDRSFEYYFKKLWKKRETWAQVEVVLPWQCFSSQAVALQAVRQTEISYVVPPTPVTFLTLVCLLGVPEGVPRWQSRAWPFSCPLTLPWQRSSLCGEISKNRKTYVKWLLSNCMVNCYPYPSFFRKEEIQTYYMDWNVTNEFMKKRTVLKSDGRDCIIEIIIQDSKIRSHFRAS